MTGRKRRWMAGLTVAAVCVLPGQGTARAKETGDSVVHLAEPETAVVAERLTQAQFQNPQAPREEYRDESGRLFRLVSWEVRERDGGRRQEREQREVIYRGVEGAELLPEEISSVGASDGETEGALRLCEKQVLDERWEESLRIPVTFHAYGAEAYQLGEVLIESGNELEEAAENGEELLKELGLSSQEYEITSLVWDGEAFADEAGSLCRQALALGRKRLKDYGAVYEGTFWQEEPSVYERTAVYRAEESSFAAQQEPEPRPLPEAEPQPLWYRIRSGFVITAAVGLIAGMAGGIWLLLLWRRRKKRRRRLLLTEDFRKN